MKLNLVSFPDLKKLKTPATEGGHTPMRFPVSELLSLVAVQAGMSAAVERARMGAEVVLFEAQSQLGGQFLMARQIPGKSEFNETIRYFSEQLKLLDVELRLSTMPESRDLAAFDEVVIATGVKPRSLTIEGADRPEVVSYVDVLQGRVEVGERVAIIGAGGIGFDVADFLTHDADGDDFMSAWGVDKNWRIGVV